MEKSIAGMDKKKRIQNLIKWVLVLGLLAFAFIKKKEFMLEALAEIAESSKPVIFVCFALANLYFIAEGIIISRMTATGENTLTIPQGIACTYMCAFYRLATFGSGNGIAQVYYYSTKGIDISRATGMSIVQYTFQKITIGIVGVASFVVLIFIGDRQVLEYTGYMIAGVIVISLICLALFLITVSKTISNIVMGIAYKLVKKGGKLYAKLADAQHAIDNLQDQGRIVWHNKKVFLQVIALDVLKLACWYLIPGVYFYQDFKENLFMCLAIMAVVNMLGCVMLAPSGMGTLELMFAIFFGAIIPDDHAIAAALVVYRFFTWIVPFLFGLFPALLLNKKDKKESPIPDRIGESHQL